MASATRERFKVMRGKPADEARFFWSGGPIEIAKLTWFQSRFSGVTAFETDDGTVLVDRGMAPSGPQLALMLRETAKLPNVESLLSVRLEAAGPPRIYIKGTELENYGQASRAANDIGVAMGIASCIDCVETAPEDPEALTLEWWDPESAQPPTLERRGLCR